MKIKNKENFTHLVKIFLPVFLMFLIVFSSGTTSATAVQNPKWEFTGAFLNYTGVIYTENNTEHFWVKATIENINPNGSYYLVITTNYKNLNLISGLNFTNSSRWVSLNESLLNIHTPFQFFMINNTILSQLNNGTLQTYNTIPIITNVSVKLPVGWVQTDELWFTFIETIELYISSYSGVLVKLSIINPDNLNFCMLLNNTNIPLMPSSSSPIITSSNYFNYIIYMFMALTLIDTILVIIALKKRR